MKQAIQHLLDENARLRAVLWALVDCPEIADDMEVSIYTARIRKTARKALRMRTGTQHEHHDRRPRRAVRAG